MVTLKIQGTIAICKECDAGRDPHQNGTTLIYIQRFEGKELIEMGSVDCGAIE